ncbi:hypothetical protein DFH08DRAFT_986532 [Mycena albidolilacea]|uniref:TPR-like protein n=1 Tax=Mycena albidolilacea TaxID=1033008 RepID=A0AAD7E8Y1_9AGAR|nr:hypothetical protein DFH08DRAFT_986532 [Mycena albidolilacea]
METRPVDRHTSHDLWKIEIDYKIPLDTAFSVNILRDNETTSPSLLGSASIGANQIDSGKHEQSFGLELPIAVPSLVLELTAQLTISESTTPESSRFATRLMQMFDATTRNATFDTDFLELWVIHENILLLPNTDRIRTDYLNKLGHVCWIHYQTSQLPGHLDRAISAHSDAVENGWENPLHLRDLGIALHFRFEQLGEVDDIDKALRAFKKVDELIPIHDPLKQSSVSHNLGKSFLRRFERLGRVEDVQHAVVAHERANELIPDDHPTKPVILNDLGQSLMRRFERFGNRDDIDRSIILSERSIQITPRDDPDRPWRLNGLGRCLMRWFERLGDVNINDIHSSIQLLQEAVDVASDGDPRVLDILSNLGASLTLRFIALVPNGHRNGPWVFNNLGNALYYRFEQLNYLTDLNRAVTAYWNAVKLAPKGHPGRLAWIDNLGDALRCRFERLGNLGDITDLNDSVTMLKEVVENTPPDDPERPGSLNSLANALQCRFEWFGARKDIDEAILALQEASLPDDHPRKPSWLNNLGSALLYRFERYERESDIEECLRVLTACVQSTKENDPNRCERMSNFGIALLQRCKWQGNHADLNDLTEAVSVLREAAEHMGDDHAGRLRLLNNLSNALQIRGERCDNLSDIKASIYELQKIVQLTPENHPTRPGRLGNLANALIRCFRNAAGFEFVGAVLAAGGDGDDWGE